MVGTGLTKEVADDKGGDLTRGEGGDSDRE